MRSAAVTGFPGLGPRFLVTVTEFLVDNSVTLRGCFFVTTPASALVSRASSWVIRNWRRAHFGQAGSGVLMFAGEDEGCDDEEEAGGDGDDPEDDEG
jgi:hypothetical protein